MNEIASSSRNKLIEEVQAKVEEEDSGKELEVLDESEAVESEIENDSDKESELTDTDYEESDVEDETELDIQLILNLPFEIFSSICSHLDPKDLLSLCHSSTRFGFLKLSESKSMWILPKKNVDLPDLLLPMESEYHYARLMYPTNCMICGDSLNFNGNFIVDHSYRIICCLACKKTSFISLSDLTISHETPPEIMDCLFQSQVIYTHFFIPFYRTVAKGFSGAEIYRDSENGDQIRNVTDELKSYVVERVQYRKKLELDGLTLRTVYSERVNVELRLKREQNKSRRIRIASHMMRNRPDEEDIFDHWLWNESEENLLNEPPKFTRSEWRRTRKEFNRIVVEIEEEMQALNSRRVNRKEQLSQYFDTLLTSYTKDSKPFFITLNQYFDTSKIEELYDEDDEDDTLSQLGIAIFDNEILEEVEAIMDENLEDVSQLIQSAQHAASNLPGSTYVADPAVDFDYDLDNDLPEVFSYITSQIYCDECKSIGTVFNLSSSEHKECSGDSSTLSVDPRRILALWNMLGLIGEHEDVSPHQMDIRADRFVCAEESCKDSKFLRTWRATLNHALIYHKKECFPCPASFRLPIR